MKKILRIFGIILLVVFGLHMIFGAYIWISNSVFLGSIDTKNTEYLKSNSSSSPNGGINERFFNDIFDSEFYNSQVILLGENHGFEDVQKIDLALLKHLNNKIGLRHYIAEMDYSLGNKLNSYIQDSTENEEILIDVVNQMKDRIPQQASQELYDKWKEIKKFNMSLPDSLRITVVGIDKDLSDKKIQISRDSAMVKNLIQFIDDHNLQDEKFYGLFGYFHVMQKPVGENSVNPFASRLVSSNNNSVKNVKSIVVYHLDSQVYFPKNDQFPTPDSEVLGILNDDGPITLVKGINDLKRVTKPNTITLFNLNSYESPYKNSQNLAGIKVNFFGADVLPRDSKNHTVKYFQYVILGRDSKALTKF